MLSHNLNRVGQIDPEVKIADVRVAADKRRLGSINGGVDCGFDGDVAGIKGRWDWYVPECCGRLGIMPQSDAFHHLCSPIVWLVAENIRRPFRRLTFWWHVYILERKPPGKNKHVIVRVVKLRFWSQSMGLECSTVCRCGLSFLDLRSDGGSSLFSCCPSVQFERGMGLPGDVVGVQDGSALRTSQRPGHCQIWLVAQCALVGPLLETTPADDVLTVRHGKSAVWFLFEA